MCNGFMVKYRKSTGSIDDGLTIGAPAPTRARTFLGPSTTIATGMGSRGISITVTISQQKISTSLVAELGSGYSSAAPLPWARPTADLSYCRTSLTNLGQNICDQSLGPW